MWVPTKSCCATSFPLLTWVQVSTLFLPHQNKISNGNTTPTLNQKLVKVSDT